jgi:flavin reductase
MITREDYRNGMARMAAAVNIVASDGAAGLGGFTASAVCSVTDDPPTLLVCLNMSSRQNDLVRTNGVLCVNTLSAKQAGIARAFADRDLTMAERFSAADWTTLTSGAPVLDGALASFDCRIVERLEQGSHAVLFCEVLAVRLGGGGGALVYFHRAFRRLADGF